ncbi:MAG: hypothetical protein WDZ61_00890 [Parcubacteria group bacterium]
MDIKIDSPEEKRLKDELDKRTDPESERLKRFLSMPDLSRVQGNPLQELVKRITSIEDFENFDVADVPEIVPTSIAFDLFDFAEDHPARSKSDTYYIGEENILRPHTTVYWYYYLTSERAKEKMAKKEPIGVFCHGKVYRKDEIDRKHMNVFHQIDGLYLVPKTEKEIELKDLQDMEAKIVKVIFGEKTEFRFAEETFPYTHPSTEIEVKKGDDWLEILGSGVVKPSVLEKLGVDSSVYNGWAFGSGIERWAMISMELPDIRLLWSEDERVKAQMVLGQKYKEVSKFPPVVRDISFVVPKSFVPNDYFDLIREVGGDMVEEVALIDEYENDQKFGTDKKSFTYRVTYRHLDKTLTSEEVNDVQAKLEEQTEADFGAEIRRD